MPRKKRGPFRELAPENSRADSDPFDLTFLKLLSSAALMGVFAMLPALLMTWLLRIALGIETGTALVCSLLAILIGTVMVHSVGNVGITELILREMLGKGVIVPDEEVLPRRRRARSRDESPRAPGADQAAGFRLHGDLREEGGTEGDSKQDN